MTKEERAKLAFEYTRSSEFMDNISYESEFFLDICGLDKKTYITELEKVAKK